MKEVTNELERHYGQLLGIESPWRVAGVKLELENKKVEIALERTIGEAVRCPECGSACALKDYLPERRWRHLDVMRFLDGVAGTGAAGGLPGAWSQDGAGSVG